MQAPLDLNEFFDKAKKYILEHKIEGVVSITDTYSMMHAALSDALPETIRGPSLEAAFLTLNKHYTHLYADPDPVANFSIDLDGDIESQLRAHGEPQFPLFTKPAAGTASAFTAKVDSKKDLISALKRQSTELKAQSENLHSFLSARSKKLTTKFTYALKDLALVEEYVPETTKITVDGYISGGVPTLFAIVDNNYWTDRPDAFESCTFPSILCEKTQQRAKDLFFEVVGKIKDRGFDNQLIDVEMFVRSDGRVQVMEVNGRMFGQFIDVYKKTLHNGDNFELATKLSLGETPEPISSNGRFGGNFYISTYGSGRASELLNFEKIESLKEDVAGAFSDVDIEVDRLKYTPDSFVPSAGAEGNCLFMCNIVGPDRDSVTKAAAMVREMVLKKPHLSAGFETSGGFLHKV